MLKFAANLNWLFQEHAFLDRFSAARDAGFSGVEILNPYAKPPDVVAERLQSTNLECALINVPRGNWDAGERGLAAVKGREAEFEAHLAEGLRYCAALRCPILHILAGVGGDHATYIANLFRAAQEAAKQNVTLTIEPLNPRDMPGYFLRTQSQAAAILEAVAAPNLKIQMDLYHMQITEGDLETKLRQYFHLCGHIQAAGVPGRNEPSTGEVRYGHLFRVLRELNYEGWIGCEYQPLGETVAGLGWRDDWMVAE